MTFFIVSAAIKVFVVFNLIMEGVAVVTLSRMVALSSTM